MKETFYFSHDYNARSDIKIKRLIQNHGMAGYGIYWSLIEDLYQNNNELELDYELISYDLRVDINLCKSVIDDFNLFIKNENKFGSKSVENRLKERDIRSKKASKNAMKRWGESDSRNKAEHCIFYVLSIFDQNESFIKCGITTESISRRYSGKLEGYDFVVLYQLETTTLNALEIERGIKEFGLKYMPKRKFGGYLECYGIEEKEKILQFAMQCECNGNAIKESKVKESKVKESKGNESKENKQTQKTASQIAEEEKKIYSEYYEYMSQQTRVEQIGMRYSLPPTHAPLLVKDFFETCLASILECKSKRHVEQYFHNWAAKPDRVQQSITNQLRIIKHAKGKEHTT